MQDYDRALKLLLRRAAPNAIRQLSGITVTKWLDVELPKTQGLRMDLLGEDHDGELHHFELQSFNDAKINVRMAEYKLGTLRLTGKFSHQIVLYVGEAPPSMPTNLRDTFATEARSDTRRTTVGRRRLSGQCACRLPQENIRCNRSLFCV